MCVGEIGMYTGHAEGTRRPRISNSQLRTAFNTVRSYVGKVEKPYQYLVASLKNTSLRDTISNIQFVERFFFFYWPTPLWLWHQETVKVHIEDKSTSRFEESTFGSILLHEVMMMGQLIASRYIWVIVKVQCMNCAGVVSRYAHREYAQWVTPRRLKVHEL